MSERSSSDVVFGGLLFRLPAGWFDVTEPGDPPTLAMPDGVGVLQFSVAQYLGGASPNPQPSDLVEMLTEFAASHGLENARDPVSEREPVLLAAATFSQDSATVRAWYISDGRNVAKFTYTSVEPIVPLELVACEDLVRSVRWGEAG